ncbi:glutathione S-transferase N-terminal domain-containing protein [Leptolyngbya ohadii]|uniref:glutathione S-transferase N-terminal domain-containing protein n=1 Tax=Leptolyngbya ohadii TaxID=1962290 RepID=UPI001179B981|nr:glutathione S-transferase N-terminal domain-containing protein [Leptolyngbya ohadii]
MLTLVIGNKSYLSWSLRAWLALKQTDLPFTEIKLPLDTPEFYDRIFQYSPSGKVPVLIHDERTNLRRNPAGISPDAGMA